MDKKKNNSNTSIPDAQNAKWMGIGFLAAIVVVGIGFGLLSLVKSPEPKLSKSEKAVVVESIHPSTFSYKGKEGVDALTLLKEKTSVEQNGSGLVVSINDRKADQKKKEFWALYVNGEMAQVGPKEYTTKDTDTIEWKIETY